MLYTLANKFFRNTVFTVILVLGIALSILVSVSSYTAANRLIWQKFNADVENRNSALKREVEINLHLVRSLQSLHYHATKNEDVSRSEFRNFTRHILKQYEDVQALAWIPGVPDSRRAEYESSARREGLTDFLFAERTARGTMERARKRKEYFPVYFVEPYKENERLPGFDFASEPALQEAMERARRSGEIIASGKINLFEEAASQVSIAVFAPVYRRGALLNSDQARWDNLEGFSAGIFRLSSSVEEALNYLEPEGIDFIINDASAREKEQFLYKHVSRSRKMRPPNEEPETRFKLAKTLDVAGRKWMILYWATPERVAASIGWGHWGFLLAGFAFTGFVSGFLFVSARDLVKVENTAKDLSAANATLSKEIAERRRAEESLRSLTLQNQAILAAVPDIIMEVDNNRIYRWANKAGYEFFGDDVIGREEAFYFAGEKQPQNSVQPLCNEDDDVSYIEILQRRKDGEKRLLAWWCRVLKDLDGKATGVLSTARDITEFKHLEAQLRHAQKMEAVGTLAGGIAHDFNNMLNVIMGYGNMVMDSLAADSPSKGNMREVLIAAERAAGLTKRLLVFSRKQVAEVRPLDINELIRGLKKMLVRIISENIEFTVDFVDMLLIVRADAGQLEQVLMNLATNARDAMPKGGRLTIGTGVKIMDNEYVSMNGYGVPGKYAHISVADTGQGMDAETQKKIFEPFFTTKGIGEGTGLGLAISYGIIKQHNGYIKVYSESGIGTVFNIYLPLVEETAGEDKKAIAAVPVYGGRETILVAEDDAALRKWKTIVLESSGYTVISAEDGDEAVAKFMENKDRIRLAILDMIMPKKNGKEVSEAIRNASSRARILFTSGYTMDVIKTKELAEAGFDFLLKPISSKDLLRKVREVLDK